MKPLSTVLSLLLCTVALSLQAPASDPDPCSRKTFYWSKVYKPERLTVEATCTSVTGIIVDATAGKRRDGVRHEGDGDCHGWLKLDSGQQKFLNAGNKTKENGNLVFEIQCLFKVTQADAKKACANWQSDLVVPPVGSHVRMWGSWVQDDNHSHWFELHPVFQVNILK